MRKLRGARHALAVLGPSGFVRAAAIRTFRDGLTSSAEIVETVEGARLLEIGGPSSVFRSGGLVPLYPAATAIDNINFAGATLWEHDLVDGGTYAPEDRRLGTQWLREATDLGNLTLYDGVVSSHTIEHVANPLRALNEWRQHCNPLGSMILVLPHRDGTFDHRRPITPLEHLRQDEALDMGESDQTHAAEVLRLHDIDRDFGLTDREELEDRIQRNADTRAMHHHVFSTRSALAMVAEAGWTPIMAEAAWPHDIVILARNGGTCPETRVSSVFPSDRPDRS